MCAKELKGKKKRKQHGAAEGRERISKETQTMGKINEPLLPLAIISPLSAPGHAEMEQTRFKARNYAILQICFPISIFPS